VGGTKGIALRRVAGFEAAAEPAYALGRGAMCEGVGHHIASSAFLQRIVANGVGGVQAFFDIARFQGAALGVGMVGPFAGPAVGLQFHAIGHLVGGVRACVLAGSVKLFHDAQLVLDVVGVLVGDDISLRTIAV